MKILITGSGTLIGNNIANYLLKKKKFIFAIYNKHKPQNLKRYKNCKLVKADLEKKIKFNNYFDVLIHCASKIPNDKINKKNFKANIKMTNNLLKLCKKFKCKRIIYLSTMSVYGKIKSKIVYENLKPKNIDLYGLSKKISENKILSFAKKNFSVATVFRLPGIVGKDSKYNFLSNTLNKIKNNQPITISNLNDKFNNVVHINNLQEIVYQSVRKEKLSQIYNLSSIKPIKIKSVIKLFYQKLAKEKNYVIQKKRGGSFIICQKKIKENDYKLYSTKKSIIEFININK
jgi:nucleoside-diphosphate-sugar epimerase